MNYYVFNYTNKEGETKELKLRLTSADAIEIENSKKVGILEYISQETMVSIITILRYLVRNENNQFSFENAQKLYDELIDSGMTMKTILKDIIYEALVVSGFLEKEKWEEMKRLYNQAEAKAKEILQENILN